ncbi:MAG: hypothetical protein AAGA31_21710 [Bacteroidota bacterium]
MKFTLFFGAFFFFTVSAACGQHYIHIDSLTVSPEMVNDSTGIPIPVVKEIWAKGQDVTTKLLLRYAIYPHIRYPAIAKNEKDGERILEAELLIDTSGSTKPGTIRFIKAKPQLGPAFDTISLWTSVTCPGPDAWIFNPPEIVPGTQFTKGEVALINEVAKTLSRLPAFLPGQLDGKPVNSRMILHFDFRWE